MNESLDEHKYYASPGLMNDPGNHSDLLDDLPDNIASLCEIIQNNLVHIFWVERYGVQLILVTLIFRFQRSSELPQSFNRWDLPNYSIWNY